MRRGVPDGDGNLEHFVVGKVLEAGKHPNADKLQLTKVDVGDGEPRSIVCGAWNFGAGATVAVVAARRVMPGGELHDREAQAARRGLRRDDPLRARARARPGPRRDHGARRRRSQPGTPLADVLPLGDDVLEIETLYNRPDLTSIYGIAREVAALTGAELQPMPGTEPRATATSRSTIAIEDLDALPALHRAPLPRRDDRRVAGVAEGAPARRRHAADLERRRHHQLRDARARQPAARVRLRHARRRTDRRAPRAAGREARDARRHAARARSRRSRDRRRRAADRDRRRDGRREHRGRRRDDVGPARGRELRAADRAAQRRAPPHAHREPDPLGEGRRPGARGRGRRPTRRSCSPSSPARAGRARRRGARPNCRRRR